MTQEENEIKRWGRDEILPHKRRRGSIKGLFPVRLADGITTVYIKDPAREQEIRAKYERL